MKRQLGFLSAEILAEMADEDKRIWVLDGDLADSEGAEVFAKKHPGRFRSIGIAEQSLVSIAAGMATCGARPWVYSFASFLCYRAYDQIRVGISQTKLPVVLVGSHAGACLGRNGKTHTALNDIAVMSTLPGIHVWAPADEKDLRLCIGEILDYGGPAYIRLPKEPQAELELPYHQGLRSSGVKSSMALVSYGASTEWALQAQRLLEVQGIPIEILHFSKLSSLNQEKLVTILSDKSYLLVIEDHYESGGLGDCFRRLLPQLSIESMGWPEDWSGQSGDSIDLLDKFGPNPLKIYHRVQKILEINRP